LLEGTRNYPTESVWWIALFILNPTARGKGLGHAVINNFINYVRVNDGKTIMLGVVEDNKSALLFWKKQGFNKIRQTEPRQFGRKLQKVIILQRSIIEIC